LEVLRVHPNSKADVSAVFQWPGLHALKISARKGP
jgi:hypothetical protein